MSGGAGGRAAGLIRVGELARGAGLSVEALRHYERIGIIQPVRRSEGRQRLYALDTGHLLQVVRVLQRLGFGLRAIAELLASVREYGGTAADQARREVLLADVRARLADMEVLREALASHESLPLSLPSQS